MKEKIIKKATEMFLKLGFKSVTMDDIIFHFMLLFFENIFKLTF